jgi:hypothetical protein
MDGEGKSLTSPFKYKQKKRPEKTAFFVCSTPGNQSKSVMAK